MESRFKHESEVVFQSLVVARVAIEIQVSGACTNENGLGEKGYLVPSSWSTVDPEGTLNFAEIVGQARGPHSILDMAASHL